MMHVDSNSLLNNQFQYYSELGQCNIGQERKRLAPSFLQDTILLVCTAAQTLQKSELHC